MIALILFLMGSGTSFAITSSEEVTCGASLTEREILDVSSISPLEALILNACFDVILYGSYGQRMSVARYLGKPRWTGYMLDGIPLSDPQLEDFDGSWLPRAGISKVIITDDRKGSLQGSHSVDLVTRHEEDSIPTSLIGIWWGDFASRALDFTFTRSVGRASILGAYEDVASNGWLGGSYDSQRYLGKVETKVAGIDLSLWALGYTGKVGSIDSCSSGGAGELTTTKRRQVAASVMDSLWQVSLWHLKAKDVQAGGEDLLKSYDGVILNLRTRLGKLRPLVKVGFGSKRYSRTGAATSTSDYWGWLRVVKGARTSIDAEAGVIRNSDFGFDFACRLSLKHRHTANQIFGLNFKREFIYPGLEWLLRKNDGSLDSEKLIDLRGQWKVKFDRVVLALTAFGSRYSDALLWRGDSLAKDTLTPSDFTAYGFETCLEMGLGGFARGSVSYLYCGMRTGDGDRINLRPTHTLAFYFNVEPRLSKHVTIGTSLGGRWVSNLDISSRIAQCRSCCPQANVQPSYLDAILVAYISIDQSRAFVRIRNLLDETIVPVLSRPALPGRSYEFGMAWHLLD